MVDNVQANGSGTGKNTDEWVVTLVGASDLQLINVGMEDAIDKSDAGALIRILIREFDVDFPVSTSERRCARLAQESRGT